MSEEMKVSPHPMGFTHSVVYAIVVEVNEYVRGTESCTPVGAAKKFHELATAAGLRSEADEIFYNFDDQYKVKFEDNCRQQVAVFWAPWMGGVSWRIEDVV